MPPLTVEFLFGVAVLNACEEQSREEVIVRIPWKVGQLAGFPGCNIEH